MFKIGDKVVCIEPSFNTLVKGQIYTISHVDNEEPFPYVGLKEIGSKEAEWVVSRFELVKEKEVGMFKAGAQVKVIQQDDGGWPEKHWVGAYFTIKKIDEDGHIWSIEGDEKYPAGICVSPSCVELVEKNEWIDYDGRAGKPEHLHDNDKVEWVNSLGMSNTHTAGYLEWSGCGSQPVVKYKVVEYYQPEEQPTDAIPPEYVALGEELVPVQIDVVNHPNHYQGKVECIDAIESAVAGKTGLAAVCTANIIKYLWRSERKNGLEDVKKAQWYLNKLIEHMEEQDAPTN